MHYNEYTLPNGLRIIHEPTLSKVAYCGFAIDAGTRDEAEDEQGMAHFVEHLIFKGTEKRKAWHILNRMENVGGDLNAYTNKEETVVYAAFLTGHLERALELLGDIVFHSTFPQHEIEKETEVIIDEIQSYEDNPSELIFDDFEDMIFRNHPLGRNILGKPELLRSFRTEEERLQNEMSLAYNLYNQTAQQLQLARAKVQESTPVYAVVQPATVPLKPSKPSKMMILVGCVFLAGTAAAAWLLFGREFVGAFGKQEKTDDSI